MPTVKANANQLLFGGHWGSGMQPVGDTGDKIIQFNGSGRVDAIIIDGKRYGGTGGDKDPQATATFPPNGTFTLTKIQSRGDGGGIAYFEAKIGDTYVSAGNKNDQAGARLECNLTVRFLGINCSQFVESILFEIVD